MTIALTFVCLLAFQGVCTPAFSDSDTDDWGNPVEPPPMPRPKSVQQTASNFSFKSFLPHFFGKKRRQGKGKPAGENTNPAAGAVNDESKPLDPPARPFPLLRLSRTIQAGTNTLNPGIFLAVAGRVTTEHPFGQPPRDDKQRVMTLLQRNMPCLVVVLERENPLDDAVADDGQPIDAPSPLTKIDPKDPPVVRVETQVAEDGQTVTFLWKEDNLRFRSKPFQVVVDSRPVLRY